MKNNLTEIHKKVIELIINRKIRKQTGILRNEYLFEWKKLIILLIKCRLLDSLDVFLHENGSKLFKPNKMNRLIMISLLYDN